MERDRKDARSENAEDEIVEMGLESKCRLYRRLRLLKVVFVMIVRLLKSRYKVFKLEGKVVRSIFVIWLLDKSKQQSPVMLATSVGTDERLLYVINNITSDVGSEPAGTSDISLPVKKSDVRLVKFEKFAIFVSPSAYKYRC